MILFVGDKPSAKMKLGARAFEGAACEPRLLEWISAVSDGDMHEIINSHEYWRLLGWLAIAITLKYPIVALGNDASSRLTKMGHAHFKLPHPSGRNRQINDKEFISKKLAKCKEWLKSVNQA